MIERNVDITIPLLWGNEHFIKNQWGSINFLVGPNGTGKSLLAEQIKIKFDGGGFLPRYLNAERLTGLEKAETGRYGGGGLNAGFNISYFEDYKNRAEHSGLSSSAIVILKQRLDIKIKIEALLSDVFGKRIRLAEEGGFLIPRMQNINNGSEYNLSSSECHGLKELITLLTILYDPSKNCIIFDEPELHLHPQYQSFFLQEIRKIAGNPLVEPNKKIFFIITHSPYFIDLKTIEDLSNVLVCHLNKPPTFIGAFDEEDRIILKKFLPRFNTHHKQFFFSPNPVFVEGYTDQQIISILLEKLDINIGASGSCVIDVGGKDELGVFYKLCKSLKINCRIIADLDSIFRSRLRRVICEDPNSQSYIQQNGIGENLSNEIGNLETKLSDIGNYISTHEVNMPNIVSLKVKINSFPPNEEHSKRVAVLLAICKYTNDIRSVVDTANVARVNFIIGRIAQLFNAFKACNTFILPLGEIEHYYTQTEINYLNIINKDTCFHTERDYILQIEAKEEVETNYSGFTAIIKDAVPIIEIEILKHVRFEVFEWIHSVQIGIAKGEINNEEDLKRNSMVKYPLYNQILELQSLTIFEDRTFVCNITIKEIVAETSIEVQFNQSTNAHNFEL